MHRGSLKNNDANIIHFQESSGKIKSSFYKKSQPTKYLPPSIDFYNDFYKDNLSSIQLARNISPFFILESPLEKLNNT